MTRACWIAALLVACGHDGSAARAGGGDAEGSGSVEVEPERDDAGGIATSTSGASASGSGAGGSDAPADVPTLPPEPPGFVDVTAEAGLDRSPGPARIPPYCLVDDIEQEGEGDYCIAERFLGAAAVGDYDGDGWPDLYLTALDGAGRLFRNRRDATFDDVTAAVGLDLPFVGGSAAWVDVDADADLDLVVTGFTESRHLLFVNDGAGSFIEDGAARGVTTIPGTMRLGTGIGVGDYDRDGDLDLFVAEWRPDDAVEAGPDHNRLLRNDGTGVFEDVTEGSGIDVRAILEHVDAIPGVYGFAPAFVDLDGDGWPELLLAADFHTSQLYWNEGGTFVDVTLAAGVSDEQNGMGSAIGDIDGDGDLDWFVTAIASEEFPGLGNRLYLNDGARSFTDTSLAFGVRDGGWGWGAVMFDHDLDGDLELAMTAGWLMTKFSADPMRLWEDDGAGAWSERAAELGLDFTGQGRGLVAFDYDRDGDRDLLVAAYAEAPILYRNDVAGGSWLTVDAPVGSEVRVQVDEGGVWQVRQIGAGAHFFAQSEARAHFGLGDAKQASRVVVRFPSGSVTELGPAAGAVSVH